ncbi:hypothetical protein C8R43DRAFT_947805 [Mycena crocata]|nr:hypothetical protein C8R43DRAFT_947805 [Mycena crocata]
MSPFFHLFSVIKSQTAAAAPKKLQDMHSALRTFKCTVDADIRAARTPNPHNALDGCSSAAEPECMRVIRNSEHIRLARHMHLWNIGGLEYAAESVDRGTDKENRFIGETNSKMVAGREKPYRPMWQCSDLLTSTLLDPSS